MQQYYVEAWTYAVVSLLAMLAALLLTLLFIADLGDGDNTLNLAAWFSWHVFVIIALVMDYNLYTNAVPAPNLAGRAHWQRFLRMGVALVAALQALAFTAAAIVFWTQASPADDSDNERLLFRPGAFFGLASVITGALACVYALAFMAISYAPARA